MPDEMTVALADRLAELFGGVLPLADPEMMARVAMEQVPALLTLHPDIAERFFQQLVLAIRERTERQSQVWED